MRSIKNERDVEILVNEERNWTTIYKALKQSQDQSKELNELSV